MLESLQTSLQDFHLLVYIAVVEPTAALADLIIDLLNGEVVKVSIALVRIVSLMSIGRAAEGDAQGCAGREIPASAQDLHGANSACISLLF